MIANVLSRFWLPNIENVCFNVPQNNLKSWLADEQYCIKSIISQKHFELAITNRNKYIQVMAEECFNFEIAAFESVLNINEITTAPKSHAWLLITLYYAAFFSAHAILRIFGRTCTQFERGHMLAVMRLARSSGLLPATIKNIDAGSYLTFYDLSNNFVRMKKVDNSHVSLWVCFEELLKDLRDYISPLQVPTKIKNKLILGLIELSDSLSDYNRKLDQSNWLSIQRNKINYQLPHSFWYPYVGTRVNSKEIVVRIKNIESNFVKLSINKNNYYERFVDTSIKIICLLKELHYEMCHKSIKIHNFQKPYIRELVKKLK